MKHPKATRDPDLLHAFEFDLNKLTTPVPLEDGCAEEVHSYHFLEHVRAYEAPALVNEFKRLLKPGGLLVLELPNIELAARNLLSGMDEQMSIWPLYGNHNELDPYMLHKFGYTPKTITLLLEEVGFTGITMCRPQTHGARVNRDMRVEAINP